MNIKGMQSAIEALADLLEKHPDLTELEVEQDGQRVKVCRQGTPMVAHTMPAVAQGATVEAPSIPAEEAPSGEQVRSPMVGTFYRAPSPQSSSFVEVGQTVKVGDTLCIIEAMKSMNPIESDKAGVVKAILVDNGNPVEFDQPLFIIE